MRIATFNLENLDDRPGTQPDLASRVKVLRPQLVRLDADILCLQEVNAQTKGGGRHLSALETLLAGTPYADFHLAVTTNRAGSDYCDVHNLVILSRWPIAAHRQYWHDLVPPPEVRTVTAEPPPDGPEEVIWDRPVLHGEIALEGGRVLHVFNLHLRSPLAAFIPGQKVDAFTWKTVAGWAEGYFLSSLKRAGQAFELRLAIDKLFDADDEAMIAVCGDFNAEEHHTPVEAIRGDEENTGNGALAMRVMVPIEHTVPVSQRFSVIHHGRGQMLDHILVSRPLLAHYRSSEIHNEALGDELVAYANVSTSPESYHAPVVARFDLADG